MSLPPPPPSPPGSDPSNGSALGGLPPDIAKQVHIASLVFSGTCAVLVWDILHHLSEDYYLFFKHQFRLSAAAYLVSRVSLHNCHTALVIFDAFYPISTGATALLFFIRVRAIYGAARLPTLLFGALWLAVVAIGLLVPLSTDATKVGTVCLVTQIYAWVGAPGIALTVHDTTVFFAISYRLLSNSHVEYTAGQRARALVRGANLHAFSKVLFRDGQSYYMITVVTNVLLVSLVCSPRVSPVYRGMMAIPNIALTNIMACRVYRNAKLHYRHIPQIEMSIGESVLRTGASDSAQIRTGTGTGLTFNPHTDTDTPSSFAEDSSSRRAVGANFLEVPIANLKPSTGSTSNSSEAFRLKPEKGALTIK
ncbi:hypothetical protein K438DRAFT_1981978 [Mycena galopus ATCC 62051]|nr:hypothetical protein K438DRAFT_1981978 [Mycena galopus ATCC 62051]